MRIKVQIQSLLRSAQSGCGARVLDFTPTPSVPTFLDTITECASEMESRTQSSQHVHSLCPPDPKPQQQLQPKLLANAGGQIWLGRLRKVFSWLRSRYAQGSMKRLRVTETVSLGEKRFVAILQVQDRNYLIGGGASNVALLTQLDCAADASTDPRRAARARGVY